jgi:hypothetical protein
MRKRLLAFTASGLEDRSKEGRKAEIKAMAESSGRC